MRKTINTKMDAMKRIRHELIIEEMMFHDAKDEIGKAKAGKAKLYKSSEL